MPVTFLNAGVTAVRTPGH